MSRIVVIGAANNDMMLHIHQDVILGDSNPGTVFVTDGGVGRNIAENLQRLGHQVTFLTVLGSDPEGIRIKANLESIGMTVIAKQVPRTPVYAAVMDASGELVVAVNDMEGITMLDGTFIKAHQDLIKNAQILIIDANLMPDALETVFLMTENNVPVYADGISAIKVKRLIPALHHLDGIKVNRLEAMTLTGLGDQASPEAMCKALMTMGPKKVILSLGSKGVMMANDKGIRQEAPLEVKIISASGAGDALFSGIIHGILSGLDPLLFGRACAALSLQSKDPVSKWLTPTIIKDMMEEPFQ